MYEKTGTRLPNVKRIVFSDGNSLKTEGAYMWPNGWLTVYPGPNPNKGSIFPPGVVREVIFGEGEDATVKRGPWDLNDDEINGATIVVNTILRGAWTPAGAEQWWNRPRQELDNKTPLEVLAHDPTTVVELALAGLSQTAT